MTDPLDFVAWEETTPANDPDARFAPESDVPPSGRPSEWNGKPIPDNAMWEEDGVTPKLTPTGRIRRSRGSYGKRDATPGTSRKTAPSPLSTAARDQLAQDLLDPIAKVALGISFMAPTVGAVLVERGEQTANAFVALSANSPRMQRALQRASKVGPAADLAELGIMLFVAAQLDAGAMQPNHVIAQVTGVGALHMSVNPGAQDHRGPTAQAPPAAAPTFTDGPTVPPFQTPDVPTDPLDPAHPAYGFRAGGPPVAAGAAVTPLRGGPFGGNFPG